MRNDFIFRSQAIRRAWDGTEEDSIFTAPRVAFPELVSVLLCFLAHHSRSGRVGDLHFETTSIS